MKNIDIFVQTPFNTWTKNKGVYKENSHELLIADELDGKVISADLSLIVVSDENSIIRDVIEHKEKDFEKYKDYDENDIQLESIKIKNGSIICNYTINAGVYRRICVGQIASTLYNNNKKQYIVLPPNYNGKVCW